jgi:hypothetical protein
MALQNDLWTSLRTLVKPGLQGAGIAVGFLTAFLLINWSRLTYDVSMLVPMSTIAVGGAGGGVFYYMVAHVLYPKTLWAKIFSVAIFLGACFLGLTFGLALIGQWD